ncbi:hypothetical protein DDE74_38290 [Streptomyces lydicus]|uniref:ADP-ribosylglycohydrolase n=1 Tax=Streptomyces lydicus TaxID=47763 RepID=A0A451EWE3_9ACTN|nr:ADP-ribosylglycohydrolase family protein [Streptomyces lydicus]AZS76911.1 hypothetical protein DDE74_38290 [Streptomyces lydicus]
MRWAERTAGAVIGSAVGDALGAPFEFGPAGAFSARFPAPGAAEEMCGGGGWDPGQATEFNGAVWPCLGSAVWDLRTTGGYEEAIRAAIDLGGDTDTVAAVTGGLAGAYYGLDAIPARWTAPLHVPLPGFGDRVLKLPQLLALTHRLAA